MTAICHLDNAVELQETPFGKRKWWTAYMRKPYQAYVDLPVVA